MPTIKKKIKDLTKEDVNKICKNYVCSRCPLYIRTNHIFVRLCEPILIYNNLKENFNIEIEVKEND